MWIKWGVQDHNILSPVKRVLYLNKKEIANIYTYHTEFDNTWFDRVQLLENTHVPTKSHKESRKIQTYLCSPLYSTDCSDELKPCDAYLWQNFPVFCKKNCGFNLFRRARDNPGATKVTFCCLIEVDVSVEIPISKTTDKC